MGHGAGKSAAGVRPIEAIHAKCLDCSSDNPFEVRDCRMACGMDPAVKALSSALAPADTHARDRRERIRDGLGKARLVYGAYSSVLCIG